MTGRTAAGMSIITFITYCTCEKVVRSHSRFKSLHEYEMNMSFVAAHGYAASRQVSDTSKLHVCMYTEIYMSWNVYL